MAARLKKASKQPVPGARPKAPGKKLGKEKALVDAEVLAGRQRDISVSEFFAKNRHLLGFDNPRKALLTTVKEAVDNALDACEEAGILPEVTVLIEDLQPDRPSAAKSSRYRVTVVDNGPGIVREQVEHIFGRLLYGSKFHRLKMSRGQQGIGISAAGMYGLLTTGRPMEIHTRPRAGAPAHHIELAMNTKTNRAEVTRDDEAEDYPPRRLRAVTPAVRELCSAGELLDEAQHPTGTSVSIELEGRYQRGRGSVDEFLELTAIANPHARIVFVAPSRAGADDDATEPLRFERNQTAPVGGLAVESDAGPEGDPRDVERTTEVGGVTIFPRGASELPPETKEIQPHPKGIELGMLIQMLKEAEHEQRNPTLTQFLQDRFSRVSASKASELCAAVGIGVRAKVGAIDHAQAERLFNAMQEARLPSPPTDCVAPIGVRQLLAGLLKGVRAEFYTASSRQPEVYRGRPFLIEAAIAFGGELPGDETARVIRFANRVPLQFQQSACSSFKAVLETSWKNYGLSQPRGGAPVGPLVVMIHVASVWVPFTSESKEAIADYDEIRKEMKLALMECGRKLGAYVRKRQKMKREGEKRDVFERYIGEIARSASAITGHDAGELYEALERLARKHTAFADVELDEDGRVVRASQDAESNGRLEHDDSVVIVGDADAPSQDEPRGDERDGDERRGSVDAESRSGASTGPRAAAHNEPRPSGNGDAAARGARANLTQEAKPGPAAKPKRKAKSESKAKAKPARPPAERALFDPS